MVNNLEKQVQQKDTEILALNDKVSNLNININVLNRKIDEIESASAQKSDVIESQENLMNTAFYAYGSSKELKENSVIEKSGGFIGIGRTSVIPKNFNRDYFTKIDIRTFDYLIITYGHISEHIAIRTRKSLHSGSAIDRKMEGAKRDV